MVDLERKANFLNLNFEPKKYSGPKAKEEVLHRTKAAVENLNLQSPDSQIESLVRLRKIASNATRYEGYRLDNIKAHKLRIEIATKIAYITFGTISHAGQVDVLRQFAKESFEYLAHVDPYGALSLATIPLNEGVKVNDISDQEFGEWGINSAERIVKIGHKRFDNRLTRKALNTVLQLVAAQEVAGSQDFE